MDAKERQRSPFAAFQAAMNDLQGRMRTAMPGIVQSFNAAEGTCEVQPAIQGVISGTPARLVNLPLLLDCPVVFPSGGGFTLTFPLEPGDEVLIVFGDRCVDGWWESGDVAPPAEYRMHDLSDGFVIPGPKSRPKAVAAATTGAQLRSDDGAVSVQVSDTGVKLKAGSATAELLSSGLTVTVGAAVFAFTSAGFDQIGGHLKHDAINIGKDHKHSGVQTGGGNTGNPIP